MNQNETESVFFDPGGYDEGEPAVLHSTREVVASAYEALLEMIIKDKRRREKGSAPWRAFKNEAAPSRTFPETGVGP